jgi:hypothetical protein
MIEMISRRLNVSECAVPGADMAFLTRGMFSSLWDLKRGGQWSGGEHHDQTFLQGVVRPRPEAVRTWTDLQLAESLVV